MAIRILILLITIIYTTPAIAQSKSGYDLWLGYKRIEDPELLAAYRSSLNSVFIDPQSKTLDIAKKELSAGLNSMLGQDPEFTSQNPLENDLIIAKTNSLDDSILRELPEEVNGLGKEGFILASVSNAGKQQLILTANEDIGILYGVYRLLQTLQTQQNLSTLLVREVPKVNLRMLNHWDNLDRTVERGYAGFSLWNWQKLPEYLDKRYTDYARANASIGINAVSLTNVNANALILTPMYLEKVEALASVFRPYGIKVFLTARFSAPMEIGRLETADPLSDGVQAWWKAKAKEIYQRIPDFGGFLVKANSEGQPGPQNYGRSHADGANMMAKALAPYGGLVIWRAFVYSEHDPNDRAKQAYSEFVPFDGKFMDNVMIQTKNGAIDFQPREPFHPMFGAMPKTPLMMEFQITQEYLGFSTHLVFLPRLFEEVLDADTYRLGEGSTVAKIVDGSLHQHKLSGMAGVSNIGTDLNWTGHPFAQANWYGFGRLAWDPYLSADTIAEEWIRATYSNDPAFISPLKEMMLESREAVVNYMNPLGLHHIFDTGHHYGPGPWVSELSRPEWNPTYYHKADTEGIGFDRTAKGSQATAQYAPELAKIFNDSNSCPEEFLLWFHHLPWDYKLKNGHNLWDGIALKYQEGVDQVSSMITTWNKLKPYIPEQQFEEVSMLLQIQLKEARWWRNACLLYFQTFSKRPLPEGVEKPDRTLEYYKSLKFPFAPGIRPRWD